jgi:threonine aldolase
MPERLVDLRSDTITLPTAAMRRAMADAEVGDDVFGEDPTVNRLEEMAAERLGKEAALFVASGTMANLVSELTHCGRGDEMILGDQAHIFNYEQGGSASVGGIHTRTVPNQPDGRMLLEDLEAAIRPDNIHFPRTRLIALENTHNRCFGSPLNVAYLREVRHLARQHGLSVHMDGARLFNAATSLNVDPADLAAEVDSVSICLSKGLAAPVGSLVCGTRSFIDKARRMRKVLGGGMRQAGVLAAAGIVALSDMTERLAEDHANARRLGDGLAQIKGLDVNPETVRSNIVYCDLRQDGPSAAELAARLNVQGVRVLAVRKYRVRAVTHYHITQQDVDYALTVFSREVSAARK